MQASMKLQFTNSRMPDLQWLIFTLAALNPKHKFFSKSFHPDKPNDPQMNIKLEQLKNNGQLQHSFFHGGVGIPYLPHDAPQVEKDDGASDPEQGDSCFIIVFGLPEWILSTLEPR